MGLFRKKPSVPVNSVADEQKIVEIVADKRAQAKVVEQAKEASDKLNALLVENGFTLKIYLAAGGKHPQRKGEK